MWYNRIHSLKPLPALGILALLGLYGICQLPILRPPGCVGPEKSCSAKIISRRMVMGRAYGLGTRWDRRVTFALAEGMQLELHANEFDYGLLQPGLSGRLTWRGRNFLDFEMND